MSVDLQSRSRNFRLFYFLFLLFCFAAAHGINVILGTVTTRAFAGITLESICDETSARRSAI